MKIDRFLKIVTVPLLSSENGVCQNQLAWTVRDHSILFYNHIKTQYLSLKYTLVR